MKLSDLLTKEEKELPKRLAKELMKVMQVSGGRIPGFKEFLTRGPETLKEIESSDELKQLEMGLHQLFGWEVHTSSHFRGRSTGRDSHVPISQIIGLFQKLRAKYPVQIDRATQMGKMIGDVDVVIQDYESNLNVVIVLGKDKVTLKTVMSIHPDEFRSGKGSNKQLIFKV